MTTDIEQETMQGVAKRFVQAAEELRISGARLFRDGIVKNDQVLSKIKNGYQKPPKKSIELFCTKYGVSAAWLYTGDGNMLLNRGIAFEPQQQKEVRDEKLLYNTDFETCLDNTGQPVPSGNETPVYFPMAGDFDFMCFNNGNSLAPIIMPGDFIALKKLSTWKTYIPGDVICVVITNEHKMLRKVSVVQDDEESITFTQMVDGKPIDAKIPKDIIIEIYKVVGNYRRQ
jgi:phage repressor protein C with HTH and peptisase S24 domain